MKSVEDFMRDLFKTRIDEERQLLAKRADYRNLFFDSGCVWDTRAGTLEMIESEKVISVENLNQETLVVTESKFQHGLKDLLFRMRYHLIEKNDRWLIASVENQCALCRGEGDDSCICCNGKKWK